MKETQKFEYTAHKVNEIKKCSQDIIYFIENYVKIKSNTTGEESLILLYRKQREVLKSMTESKKFCLESTRQSGKTLLSQLYILWKCNFFKNAKCEMVTINNSSVREIMKQMEYFQSTIPGWLKSNSECRSLRWSNEHFMDFDNGSSLVLATESKFSVRGKNLSVLIFDEYSFYSDLNSPYGIISDNTEIRDLLNDSIISTVEGQLIVTGTPKPSDNVFRLIANGKGMFTSWTKESINWDDNPNRGLIWKDEMIESIGEKAFTQEFCV